MWGILKNDIYTSKKAIVTSIIGILLHAVLFCIKIPTSVFEDEVLVLLLNAGYCFLTFMVFILFGNVLMAIIVQNEQSGWQTFMATTKTGQKGYITLKYMMAIALYVLASLYTLLINGIAYKLNGVRVSASIILLFFIFFVFQATLELPLVLRFGTGFGSYVKIVLGISVTFGIIIYGLYGNLPIFSEKNQDKMIDWALRVIREGLSGPTAKKSLLIAGVVTAILYGFSYMAALITRKKS